MKIIKSLVSKKRHMEKNAFICMAIQILANTQKKEKCVTLNRFS